LQFEPTAIGGHGKSGEHEDECEEHEDGIDDAAYL
jgi:hypothetical protein